MEHCARQPPPHDEQAHRRDAAGGPERVDLGSHGRLTEDRSARRGEGPRSTCERRARNTITFATANITSAGPNTAPSAVATQIGLTCTGRMAELEEQFNASEL